MIPIMQRVQTFVFSTQIHRMPPIVLSEGERILKLGTPKLGSQPGDWLQLGLFAEPPKPIQKIFLLALVSPGERRD